MVVQPVIESLTELILTAIEAAKVKISLKINQYSKNVQEIQESMIPTATHSIGFDIAQEGEEYFDDDEEN